MIGPGGAPGHSTPLGAAARGLVAGFGASLVLSALSRVLPGMSNRPAAEGGPDAKAPPGDRFDAERVAAWQARVQAPAAHHQESARPGVQPGGSPGHTPVTALALPEAPGPEGLAEQFAFKVASGVFGRDISHALRPAGMATHLTYGSLWGVLFGLIQGTVRHRPLLSGVVYGLAVWLVGPVTLVPAMKLMRHPWQETPLRSATMVAGHFAYGIAVAVAFEALERA